MSYEESEVMEELGFGFRLDDGIDEDEPIDPIEGADDFKFDEDVELEDPDDKFH